MTNRIQQLQRLAGDFTQNFRNVTQRVRNVTQRVRNAASRLSRTSRVYITIDASPKSSRLSHRRKMSKKSSRKTLDKLPNNSNTELSKILEETLKLNSSKKGKNSKNRQSANKISINF